MYLDDVANTTGPESHILPDGREIDVAGPTKPLMRDFVDANASSKYLRIAESAMVYTGTLGDVADGFAKHAISCRVRAMIEIAHQQVLALGQQGAGANRRGAGEDDDDAGPAKKALTFEDVKLQLCAAAEKVYGVEIRPEEMPALVLVDDTARTVVVRRSTSTIPPSRQPGTA